MLAAANPVESTGVNYGKPYQCQLQVLSDAAQHENGAAVVLNKMGSAATEKLYKAQVKRTFMRELLTKPGMPIWRKAEHGRSISLIFLNAGRNLILEHGEALHCDKHILRHNRSDDVQKSDLALATSLARPNAGSKLAIIITMLANEPAASLKAFAEITGWLPHTTWATLTGIHNLSFLIEWAEHDKARAISRHAHWPDLR